MNMKNATPLPMGLNMHSNSIFACCYAYKPNARGVTFSIIVAELPCFQLGTILPSTKPSWMDLAQLQLGKPSYCPVDYPKCPVIAQLITLFSYLKNLPAVGL